MLFSAIIHKEDNIYVAECTEVGTVSQGNTIEEAIENLKESTELFLEEFPIVKPYKTYLTSFELEYA
ncbi:MAG: type II toxin-antitoxin system HicB family antitoxin [Candidatus Kapabacteria bacterium]|nr:type II toxin-antitoxin system HicB family antitoxin [Candidatus Kapabacteria bacterium]